MYNVPILSKTHFAAYLQVIDDYKSLLVYEQELSLYSDEKKKNSYGRIKNDIIFLLQRIIENKNILKENTKSDQEYLVSLIEMDK
ncbi:MAG: hypothetical protein K2P85_04770 [Flavobacteriaceae bacterium]|nr:hypothetical protein [Flavobacteriaceae bacterium]